MLNKIEIQGYKSLKDVSLELKPINILIGGNGSGKSNFLSFFDFLNALYDQRLQEYVNKNGGLEKLVFRGSKQTDEVSFSILSENAKVYERYGVDLKVAIDTIFIYSEFLGGNGILMSLGEDEPKLESIFKDELSRDPEEKSTELMLRVNLLLNDLRKYQFQDTSKNGPFVKHGSRQNDIYYLYEDGRNIGSYLNNIRNTSPKSYKRIIHTIQSVAPFFLDFYFPVDHDTFPLLWKDKYSSTTYGASDLSDGTMRFIALCVLFLQPKPPATIIIDEPELGLHPAAIAKLTAMIRSVESKGSQVIVATQSVELINHFDPSDIVTVDQHDGATKLERLNGEQYNLWLEEYSVGDLWERNIINKGQPK